MSYHQYADDTQLYSTDKRDVKNLIARSEDCITEVKEWMNANKLKLNEDKTEVMIVRNKRNNIYLPSSDFTMTLADKMIDPVEKVRNLGTLLDSSLTN